MDIKLSEIKFDINELNKYTVRTFYAGQESFSKIIFTIQVGSYVSIYSECNFLKFKMY